MGSVSPPRVHSYQSDGDWPLQRKPHRSKSILTAVVKGGGPAGLAASIELSQSGFTHVRVLEKRPFRPEGQGRRNMVALRPEALRILDGLGALKYVLSLETGSGQEGMGCLTRMVEGKTTNEWDGSVFEWPLKRYPPAEPTGERVLEYVVPEKVNEQVPSSFITLGDLEDCLARAANDAGVEIRYDATVDLIRDESGKTKRYQAIMVSNRDGNNGGGELGADLGFPDLIVCASGKNDQDLEQQLRFQRRVGVKLEEDNLPDVGGNSRMLSFPGSDADGEIESQMFCVYGVMTRNAPMGVLDHIIRQKETGNPEQPVVEIQMNHTKTSHCLMQLPRGMDVTNTAQLDQYITDRTNRRLGTQFKNVSEMKEKGVLVWGEPLKPVIVETSTAPTYVFGSNVVLIGDAAMSCSPSSGIGAEVGLTVDSESIGHLGSELRNAAKSDRILGGPKTARQKALDSFNMRRAEASVLWSQGSRMFYITGKEASDILEQQQRSKQP